MHRFSNSYVFPTNLISIGLVFRGLALSIALVGTLSSCATTPKISKPKGMDTANAYAKDGLYKEAVAAFKKIIANYPDFHLARRNLGIVLVKVGDYTNAIKNLERVAPLLSNDFETNFYLGEAYRGRDKNADAIYRYKKSLSLRPNEGRALKALAWSYYKIRYLTDGLSTIRKFRKMAPKNGQAAIIEARILLKMRKLGSALAVIRDAKSYAALTELPYYQSVEGDILAAQRDCTVAVRVYREALKRKPLLAGSLLGMGRCYLHYSKNEKAIKYLERALRIRPELVEGHLLLGEAYEKTDIQKSQMHYRKFRKQAIKDPELLSELKRVNNKLSSLRKRTSPSNASKSNIKKNMR